jgi:hypothetical protein
MTRWLEPVKLPRTEETIVRLAAIARSRSEEPRRVKRVQMPLTYAKNPSFVAAGQTLGVTPAPALTGQAAGVPPWSI